MSILSFSPISLANITIGLPIQSPTFTELVAPLESILTMVEPLVSGCNREITFDFESQLKCLIYYHIEGHTSAKALLEEIQDNQSIKEIILPETELGESTFYEANSHRGATQMLEVFSILSKKVSKRLRTDHAQLGKLVAIDGSLIDATLSMTWAEYRDSSNKAKVHVGFDLNHSIPRKLYLTEGKGAERPYVNAILEADETGVLDRGFQDHALFDKWIDDGKHFVARLKSNTKWEELERLPFKKGGKIFFFAKILLGDDNHRMLHPVYLVGYRVGNKIYWVATDRADLTAEEIAFIYLLRWEIEQFFCWWKRQLKVYHLISRSSHGMLLQLLSGLVTYLLFILYCYERYGETKPSISRLRSLRRLIRQEIGCNIYLVNMQFNMDLDDFLLLFFINAIF